MSSNPIQALVAIAIMMIVATPFRPDWLSHPTDIVRYVAVDEYFVALLLAVAGALAMFVPLSRNLDRLEKTYGEGFFDRSRDEMRSGVFWAIALFGAGVLVPTFKPFLMAAGLPASVANATAIAVLLFEIGILVDFVSGLFAVKRGLREGTGREAPSENPTDLR